MVAVLMCSFTVFASAADKKMELGKTYELSFDNGTKSLSFTPDSDGIYEINAKLVSDETVWVNLYVTNEANQASVASISLMNWIPSDDDNIIFDDVCTAAFPAKKGNKLIIEAVKTFIFPDEGEENTDVSNAVVEISITKLEAEKIGMGDIFTVTGDFDSNRFYIIPEKTMQYNFWSYYDGEIYITDCYGNTGSVIVSPLEVLDYTQILEKGELYLVEINMWIDDDATADIHIEDGSKIHPEVIEAEDILVAKGDSSECFVRVYPLGSAYNYDNLELTMGDDSIASAEYNKEEGTITVHGEKLGKTTLTITEPISGVTTEVEVKVVTHIGYFFITLFDIIYETIADFIGF